MRMISCHDGKLQVLSEHAGTRHDDPLKTFRTGLDALDELAPGGALARAAIHEVLWDSKNGALAPRTFAMVLARAVASFSPRYSGERRGKVHFFGIANRKLQIAGRSPSPKIGRAHV